MHKFHTILSLLLCLSLQSFSAPLPDPATKSDLADLQPWVRESLGVRRAASLNPTTLQLEIGVSISEAAAQPEAYRITSLQDPNYAYDHFVRPLSAEAERISEAKGVEKSAFPSFSKTVVTLTLPFPLKPGLEYQVMAQGVGSQMVTAAKTAASFLAGQPAAERGNFDLAVIGLRRIVSIGNGILMLELGPGFAPDAAKDPSLFTVTRNGKPAPIAHMGRRTVVEAYVPVGWPFPAIPRHEWFITLDQPLAEGDLISVSIDPSVCAGLTKASLNFSEQSTQSPALKVNQLGTHPQAPVKLAYLGRWLGDYPLAKIKKKDTSANLEAQFLQALGSGPAVVAETDGGPALYFKTPPTFHLRNAQTHEIVWSGTSRLTHHSGDMNEGVFNVDHSGENVYLLDFSSFHDQGSFYLSVPGVGRSPDFRVDTNIYRDLFRAQSHGVFIQRCGIALNAPYSDWQRIACHNHGVIPTTLSMRVGEHALFNELPQHVDFSGQQNFQIPPELQALNEDPDLIAYWPLNTDLRDYSGNENHLRARAARPGFVEALTLMAPNNRAWGPTQPEIDNGGVIDHLPLSAENGISFTLWIKLTGDQKFDGVLIGHNDTNVNLSRMQITAGWGLFRGFAGSRGEPAVIGRAPSEIWEHLALVLSADSTRVQAFINGQPVSSAPAGGLNFEDLPFVVGALGGEARAGKFLDEVRVYDRALSPKEVQTLAREWGTAAISIDTIGGHHDAGDYNPRSHMEVARMLQNAYEMAPAAFSDGQLNIPENQNGIPDIIDEAAWALRLWPALQAADGSVRGGTESDGDPNFIQTVELDPKGDYATAAEVKVSFEFAGTAAQASRIYRSLGKNELADEWIQRAERAYTWAATSADHGATSAEQFAAWVISPKAYAAAELLHSTGQKTYADDFAKLAVWSSKPEADLEVHRLYDQQDAAWAYLSCPKELTDPVLRQRIEDAVLRRADQFIELCDTQAYKFFRHPWAPITWGTGTYPNQIDPAVWAWKLTGDDKYLSWIVSSVDYMLGANPLSLSYITGVGERSVRAPLHNSRYRAAGEVADGLHVQGPNQRGEGYRVPEVFYPRIREDFAPLYTYADVTFAIPMNEGTIPSMARCMALFGLLQSVNEPEITPK